MAQVTETVARGILAGHGYTDNEVRQLAHHWLATHGQAPAQPVDFTTLGAAMRAIQQAIGLIGDPADERMQAVRRVLRGAVVVAEDSGDIPAQPAPPADSVPVLDQSVMELAESVGLIGPTSRIGDLHAAIQRFHDLICVNATIKAAAMAAEVISSVAMPDLQDAVVLLRKYRRLCQEVGRGDSAHLDRIEAAAVAVQTVAARAPADSQPAPDERDDFEKVFPLSSGCVRVGTGYASTDYSNWVAHTHVERWQGWKARAALAAQKEKPHDPR